MSSCFRLCCDFHQLRLGCRISACVPDIPDKSNCRRQDTMSGCARAGSFPHIVLVEAEGWCPDVILQYITTVVLALQEGGGRLDTQRLKVSIPYFLVL